MKLIKKIGALALLVAFMSPALADNSLLLNMPIGFGDKTGDAVCGAKNFQAGSECEVVASEGSQITILRGIGSRNEITDFLSSNPAKGFEPMAELFKASKGKFFSLGPNGCAVVLTGEGCKCSDTPFGPKISCEGDIGDVLGPDFPSIFGKKLPAATVFTLNSSVQERSGKLFTADKDFCGPPPKGCFCNIKGFFQCEDGSTKQIP